MSSHRWLVPVLLACLLASVPEAQGATWIVARSGCPFVDFTEIQPAVDAASDGDVILVRPTGAAQSNYDAFAIDGKSLSLVGLLPGPGTKLRCEGVEIRNLGAAQSVSLFGFRDTGALRVENTLGPVWIEECAFDLPGVSGIPVPAVTLDDVHSIVLNRTTVATEDSSPAGPLFGDVDGRPGIAATDSTVHLFECSVTGGEGGRGWVDRSGSFPSASGGRGGDGVSLVGSSLFAADTTIAGADGGQGFEDATQGCVVPGDGGHGIDLGDVGAEAHLLATSLVAGIGGPPAAGAAICIFPGDDGDAAGGAGAANVQLLAGSAPSVSTNAVDPLVEADALALTVVGQPGNFVALGVSAVQAHLFAPVLNGTFALAGPKFIGLGFVPASGTVLRNFTVGDTVLAGEALPVFFQGVAVDGMGAVFVSAPATVTVLDSTHDPSDGCGACLIAPLATAHVGLATSFDGTSSTLPGQTIVDHAWDFGDGSTGSGPTPSHTYAAGGTFQVELTVTYSGGLVLACERTQVVNVPPICDVASLVPMVTVGQPSAFTATGSSDPDGSIVDYQWTFGDGGTASGATVPHVYAASGTYTVEVTVTDDDGGTSSCALSTTILP